MRSLQNALLLLLSLIATTEAVHAQADSIRSPLRQRTTYEDLQMFSQVLNQIRVNHYDSIDTHDLFLSAIDGMVRAADPHSYVIPAIRLDTLKEKALREGRLHPVPITFRFVGGSAVVVGTAPGSEAARQDMLPGDVLTAIDGRHVTATSVAELDVFLAGPRHSRVTLTLERTRLDGTLAQHDRSVRRERTDEGTGVPAAFMLDSITGYIRVTTFVPKNVADDLHEAIGQLEKAGMKRLLLDLRDNGGGLIDQAAKVAGEFLPKDALVYSTEGRKGDVRNTGRVSRSFWRKERRYPLVLLVNAGTASASELLAGALQDHDRAIIVGRPTFGKALVMRGFPMTDGSLIMLAVGQLKTPCGRVVQREYRNITRADYYRLSAAQRDTAGLPSCRTTSGRVVYGGGGIVPDLLLDSPAGPPVWLARIRELDLISSWAGAWSTENPDAFADLGALARSPALPAEALAHFRGFAFARGITIPTDAGPELQRLMLEAVAFARFGEAGLYRVAPLLDPTVAQAAAAFNRAELLVANNH